MKNSKNKSSLKMVLEKLLFFIIVKEINASDLDKKVNYG
jgi:hypothetical protein